MMMDLMMDKIVILSIRTEIRDALSTVTSMKPDLGQAADQ
jgi:hypothetical protein